MSSNPPRSKSTMKNTTKPTSTGFRNKQTLQKRATPQYQTNQPKVDAGEMETYRKNLTENKDFSEIPDEKLPLLHSYLREYAAKCASEENYDEAEKSSELAEETQKEFNSRKSSSVKSRGADLKEPNMQEFEKQCKDELDEYDADTDKRLQALSETQNKEKEDFEKKWREEKPQKYRKPSQRLLQLKQIEKTLAGNAEYSRAKAVHQEVEELQNYELQVAQESIIRDYNFASQRLSEKHMKEKENLLSSREHTRVLLETRQASEREARIHREKVIKVRASENPRVKPTVGAPAVSRSISRNKDKEIDGVLLPPLRAPNDPELVEETKRKQREANKKKMAYQKQNAAQTLARVSLGFSDDGGEQQAKTEEPKSKEEDLKVTEADDQKSEPEQDEPQQEEKQEDGGLLSSVIKDALNEDDKPAPEENHEEEEKPVVEETSEPKDEA